MKGKTSFRALPSSLVDQASKPIRVNVYLEVIGRKPATTASALTRFSLLLRR